MTKLKNILELALARYKDANPRIALLYFESDRRRAGLGALEKCTHGGDVTNHKVQSGVDGRIVYTRNINIAQHYRMPKLGPLPRFIGFETDDINMTATVVPARILCRSVSFERSNFEQQDGRKWVAIILWQMRKSMQ